ncbi:MAG: YbaK/EbsC family protein [Gaiellales bacterium]
MAATRGTAALDRLAIGHLRHAYEHRVKGAAFAAEALGIDPARLAKTLVVAVDGDPVFVLVPGDRDLSLKALARLAGGRSAALVDARDAERLTGYKIGGISPFGARRALPVFAERSYLEHEQVALNGGARGLIVELAGADLVRVLEPMIGDLTEAPQ